MQSPPTMVLDSHVTEDPDLGNTSENEVVDDPLSSAQEIWYNKSEKDYEEFMTELNKITEAGDVIAKNDAIIAVQLAGDSPVQLPPALSNSSIQTSTTAINPLPKNRANQNQAANSLSGGNLHVPAVPPAGVFLQSTGSVAANVVARPTSTAPGTYQLVMDPRVGGFFVGPVPSISSPGVSSTTYRQNSSKNSPQIRAPSAPQVGVSKGVIVARNDITPVPTTQGVAAVPKPFNKVSPWVANTSTAGSPSRMSTPSNTVSIPSASSSPGIGSGRGRGRPPKVLPSVPSRAIPAPSASPGGLAPVVDLTDEERLKPAVNTPLRTYNNTGTSSGKTIPASSNKSISAVNNSNSSVRGSPKVLSNHPPLTAVIPKQPMIAPKPTNTVARASGNTVAPNQVRLNAVGNQGRTTSSVNSVRSSAVNNGPSASVNNGARPQMGVFAADSREISFNKLGVGRTFPSLVVVAKPTMRAKEFSPSAVTRDRAELDQQVKDLVLNSMSKLTEWLIQQGLVRSSQVCQTHRQPDGGPVNLKLGIYSDASKFPHSGGYVWICEFCPQLFVSVFSGSIFEGAPHPPLVLLKLIYHWACQTTSSNIVSWVKVESFYVKMFFARMRAICTAAIHENYEMMGGPSKCVEVGVISLGTAAQDGTTRNVKVEVLGVMDPEMKLIRLRAVEPLRDGEKNYKRRFVKILEPMAKWVHNKSIILTDFTVDKGTLHNMGFASVLQVTINPDASPDTAPKYSNINVMNYLRKVVPRMFQNTLSLLSRQIIQQFLDELVWRERWGPLPSQAFNTIIRHIAEQTKANPGSSLLRRLGKISDDPFREWRYSAEEDEVQVVTDTVATTSANTVPSTLAPASGTVTYSTASSSVALTPVTPDLLRPSIDMLPQSIREPTPTSLEQASPSTQAQVARRGRKRPAESNLAAAERPRKRLNESGIGATDPRKILKEGKKTTPYSTVVVGTEQTTSLQSYYYGTLEGDPTLMGTESPEIPVLKCSVCVRHFTNNILLMKHLILHAQFSQFSCDLDDVTQCKYCLKTFPTPFSMQTHLEEVHLTTGSPDICMICSEKFKDTTSLIQHMHRTHVALEMPYVCHVCQFRSSMHRDLIDHFYEVHNNGEKMQCPFCLKTVAVAANGRRLGSNISFFLTHIQKHQRRSIAKKCSRCALWFVHKWAIREHLQRDHISFKDVAGVKPAQPDPSDDIKMPLPPAELGPSASLTAFRRGPHFPSRGSHSTTYLLPVLELQSNINEFTCLECKEEMGESHYPGYTMCSRCRFATCCPKAMKEHMRTFHEVYTEHPVFEMSPPIILPNSMYCVCGFTSSSGNCLAKHLAICERKSAYPSPAKAKAATVQSASFPPLVTLDDVDNSGDDPSDKWLKAFVPTRQNDSEGSRDAPEKKNTGGDTHSMLNVLGLVRKPSTDESSLDKAPSDKEDAADAPVTATT